MNTSTTNSQCYEFCFPKLDTLVQVEEADGTVVIRATRDTFTCSMACKEAGTLAAPIAIILICRCIFLAVIFCYGQNCP